MDWNLSHIKAKVRKLTGRPDIGQLSEEDLLGAINQFYVHMLPQEVNVREIQTWREIALTSTDSGEYALESSVLSLEKPFTLKDEGGMVTILDLLSDQDLFFRLFPESDTQRDRPRACLIYGRTLTLRPRPDREYTFRAAATTTLDALEDDTDSPADAKWGPFIAYGTAMEILQENGEDSEASNLRDAYSFHLNSIARKQVRQIPPDKRSAPGF
ncbi:MAG: hypothetical protein JEZ02_00125 [Desulfatibacillum sp.]|nr:hypothetical protein [Desulfatibacillum sp.]